MQPTEAAGGAPRLYMDAVIWPNRSLSPRGLKILLGLCLAYNLVLALFLILIGAFPVPVFLGLDVAGLALAFHVSNRRARRAERVQVSAEAIKVIRQEGGRAATVWASPTAFTRVAVDPHVRAVGDELRRVAGAHHAGDAVLARHDRRV